MRHCNLPAVHEYQEQLHVLEVHILEHDDGVFARVSQEQVLEVGAAHAEDELVGGEVVIPAGDCDIDELLLVAKVLRELKETLVVIFPAQHQVLNWEFKQKPRHRSGSSRMVSRF